MNDTGNFLGENLMTFFQITLIPYFLMLLLFSSGKPMSLIFALNFGSLSKLMTEHFTLIYKRGVTIEE